MKGVMLSIISVLFLLKICSCQNLYTNDSLDINFKFASQLVGSKDDLNLKVIYTNKTNRSIHIYQRLEEGNLQDMYFNIHIEMEKKEGKDFKHKAMRFYQAKTPNYLVDSLRHYDVAKRYLAPLASDTLTFNILEITGGFFPGKYRFRAHLRVATIRDNRIYDENWPPEDELKYIQSDWFYFTVKKYFDRYKDLEKQEHD